MKLHRLVLESARLPTAIAQVLKMRLNPRVILAEPWLISYLNVKMKSNSKSTMEMTACRREDSEER